MQDANKAAGLKAVLSRRMLICVATGFASGMPLYLLIQLVPAWLRAAEVSLAEIGLFALVGLPYTWKFLWAPLMDRIADMLPWTVVFWVTAAFMTVGIVLSLSICEPEDLSPPAQGLRATLLTPFTEYFHRVGWRAGALALLFMVAYKLGDNMATALATPFYLDMGFSMTEIGLVAKHAALWPAIVGGLLGGFAMLRLGINRALWIFGLIQMLSILGFAWLASGGTELWQLALVIAFEYFGVGLGTAAFTAFIARESSKAFAATQFALFTALAAMPRSLANAVTGFIVEETGWTLFFLLCTLLALPGMAMLWWVAPWRAEEERQPTEASC